MKPLNRVERSNAFLNFLLLFMLTVAVIVAAIFFSIRVPFRQNEQMRSRIELMEDQKEFAREFSVQMQETLEDLAKYDNGNEPHRVVKRRVDLKLKELERKANENPDLDNRIYDQVLQQLSDLNDAKNEVKSLEKRENYEPSNNN